MKKIMAATVAAAVSFTGIAVAPQIAHAQTVSMAEIYEPTTKGIVSSLGPTETIVPLVFDNGLNRRDIATIEIVDAEVPHAGMSLQFTYPLGVPMGRASLAPEKVYPEYFVVPYTAQITYVDGSSEEIYGEIDVYPVEGLVADPKPEPNPAPVLTPPATGSSSSSSSS